MLNLLLVFVPITIALHFLRPDDVFADVGANMGSYTILASGVSGARSYSFEPVPSTFERLQANIELNGLTDRVVAINAAVGGQPGELQFTINHDTVNHVATDDDTTPTMAVPVITLDEQLASTPPALMKIDVEGYESEVLRGARALLSHSNLRAIVIELNGSGGRYGFDEEDIQESLLMYGFRPVRYDPASRTLAALDRFGEYNTVFCRDRSYVRARLENAPSFTVLHKQY